MEKGKLIINKNKKGKYYAKINISGKEQPFPAFKPTDDKFNNSDCEVKREKGQIIEIVIDGKKIWEKKVNFSSSNNQNNFNKSGSFKNRNNNSSNNRSHSFNNRHITNSNRTLSGTPFLNPYNFVEVTKDTPKYPYTPLDMFTGSSGYIDIEMQLETPLFIGGEKKEVPIKNDNKDKDNDKHTEIKFFSIDGKPVIPGSSLKGMLRSRVEILSNSCFNYDYASDDLLNYFSHRLNPEDRDESREARNLKSGVLVKRNGKWGFIQLEKAKVLTMLDNRKKADNLYVAIERNHSKPEKLSTKSGLTDSRNGYINKKRFRKFNVENANFDTNGYKVTKINNIQISEKECNKVFPFIDLKNFETNKRYYGIIRCLSQGRFSLYKLKEFSDSIDFLQKKIGSYKNSEKKNNVRYAICELMFKPSYDMDTKTQDRVFFIFGEKDLDKYINKANNFIPLSPTQISQFRNMIKSRFEEFDKHKKKDYLFKYQPYDIYDKMPVYASLSGNPVEYITYAEIGRKPYQYGINDIVNKINKGPCSSEKELCPACNIFGFISGNKSLAGRISVSDGQIKENKGFIDDCTLNILASPKPSYWQFYLLNNRKSPNSQTNTLNYNDDISRLLIGRKQYLFHNKGNNISKDSEKSKFNVTINPLKIGSTFKFRIDYSNLNHYELGLLLYSIKTEFKTKKVDFRLGMGKPLGLGELSVKQLSIFSIDRKKRYSSLFTDSNFNTGTNEALSDAEIDKYIELFKYIQSKSVNNFNEELNKVSHKNIDELNPNSNSDFYKLPYINDFIHLNLVNKNAKKYDVKYPAKNEQGQLIGFKWFIDEKTDPRQRLFKPSESIDDNSCLKNYGL